jgi:predicted esterase
MAGSSKLRFIHMFVPAVERPPSQITLLMLHGTGGDESNLLGLGRAISPEAALLSPRGQVLEQGNCRFFRRLAEGVFDLPDLHRRTGDLAEFIQEATQEYKLNPERIVAVGFSNGANIAASLLLSRPDLLAGAILFRPMVPFEPADVPTQRAIPILMSAGSDDPIVSTASTQSLADLLRESGATVTLIIQRAGHDMISADVEKAREWMLRFERDL